MGVFVLETVNGGGGASASANECTSYEQPRVLNGHFFAGQGWLFILFFITILILKSSNNEPPFLLKYGKRHNRTLLIVYIFF